MVIPYLNLDIGALVWPTVNFVLIIVLAVVCIRLSKRLIAKSFSMRSDDKRANTVKSILTSITKYVIIFVAFVTILKTVFHIDATTIIAAAGIGGVAVGFGAQNLVRDVITGLFILIENQYQVGDRVTINGFTGEVVEIGFRVTKLKNDCNDYLMVSNGDIKAVVNHSKEPDGLIVEICVPFEDIDKAKTAITVAGDRLRNENEFVLKGPAVREISSKDENGYYLSVFTLVDDTRRIEAQRIVKEGLIEALSAAEVNPIIIR